MIPAAVLVGGRSTRMGRDKAYLLHDGRPMALCVADTLLAGGCTHVVLVGSIPGLDSLGLPVLPDPPGLGTHPLAGVSAACALGPLVLTAPCDIPSVQREDIQALLAPGVPTEAFAGGRRHPLLGVVDGTLAPALVAAARSGASARDALNGRLSVHVSQGASRNINTPAELAMLHAGAEGEHGNG